MNSSHSTISDTIDLTEFLARGPEILDKLGASGVVITKEGRPIARITPLATVNNESLIGSMKGQIRINGDIVSTGLEWDAQS
jgi:antitoxin (DNA-binding transcriptional repressor) of toxin-antitoxin stability system